MEFQALGLLLTIVIAVVGLASISFATARAWSAGRRRGWSNLIALAATVAAFAVLFLGGWLVFDLVWFGLWIAHRLKRAIPETA